MTTGRAVVKTTVTKMKEVVGAWTAAKSGQKTKWDNFTAAVSQWPYLFDLPVCGKCVRADIELHVLDALLQELGHGCFGGGFEDWGSVFKLKKEFAARGAAEADEDYDVDVQAPIEGDTNAGHLWEIVNVKTLEEFAATASEDRRAKIEEYLRRHQREGHREGDYSTMKVLYIRKHGMPGRRYAVGPSLQKLNRAERAAALTTYAGASGCASDVFVDVDINGSMPHIFWNLLCEIMGVEEATDELAIIPTYLEKRQQWSELLQKYFGVDGHEAKKMILKLFFLAAPQCDLPFLWLLAVSIQKAAGILLSADHFRYLEGLFKDRRNPVASRLHYALAATEDAILSALEQAVAEAFPASRFTTYMFDGAVVKLNAVDAGLLGDVLQKVGEQFNVSFKASAFPTDMAVDDEAI